MDLTKVEKLIDERSEKLAAAREALSSAKTSNEMIMKADIEINKLNVRLQAVAKQKVVDLNLTNEAGKRAKKLLKLGIFDMARLV